MELIITDLNGVRTLKLNRPEVFNSFNRSMALQLQSELDKCATDATVRAVIITGEGKAFCAGQDLGEATASDGFRFSGEPEGIPCTPIRRRAAGSAGGRRRRGVAGRGGAALRDCARAAGAAPRAARRRCTPRRSRG